MSRVRSVMGWWHGFRSTLSEPCAGVAVEPRDDEVEPEFLFLGRVLQAPAAPPSLQRRGPLPALASPRCRGWGRCWSCPRPSCLPKPPSAWAHSLRGRAPRSEGRSVKVRASRRRKITARPSEGGGGVVVGSGMVLGCSRRTAAARDLERGRRYKWFGGRQVLRGLLLMSRRN